MKNKKISGVFLIVVLALLYFIGKSDDAFNEQSQPPKTISNTPIINETPTTEVTIVPEKPTSSITPTSEPINETIFRTSYQYNGKNYNIIEVDGGDLSGERLPNVAVDIGFGDREYWALTNEYGQLVYVIANKIIPQDETTEKVNANGRYFDDEAKVPGTERADLDEGHVIADSMGGVSNAYNITPQNSVLNRHGDQAYMEKVIRDAGGCENFLAVITYPDNDTQIPSHYHYEYEINGVTIIDDFDNVNPDEINETLTQSPEPTKIETTESENINIFNEKEELARIDKNGNGKVTIAEAKAVGYKMPIYSDHWLYKYMTDRDGDGMVGE